MHISHLKCCWVKFLGALGTTASLIASPVPRALFSLAIVVVNTCSVNMCFIK